MDIFKTKELVQLLSDPIQIIFLLGLSTFLGMIIAWTYHKTHRGYSFSQNFSNTLILMTVITTLIIMVIGDNIARAIGIFGAFSIVRFRTAVKDARDIAFVFFVLAIGLAVGTGSLSIGIVGTLFLVGLLLLLHFINFAGPKKMDYVLNFKMDAKHHDEGVFKSLFSQYVKTEVLLNVKAKDRGNFLIFTFNVSLHRTENLANFLEALSQLEGISEVHMVTSKSDLEF